MSEPVVIPALALAELRGLFLARQNAEQSYQFAVNLVAASLGYDPKDNHQINLEQGVLIPAPKDTEAV